jgi:glycosyltransferase involved in cell wall biosynthesis
VLPFQRYAGVRAFNRWYLSAALARQVRRLGLRQPLLWTYNPLTLRLLRRDNFPRIVYHCVDDIAAQPGMPAAVLERGERELVERAAVVFTTAPRLHETRRRWNPQTHYLPNVADFAHFSKALDPALPIPADMAAIPAPRLGFIGALSGYKVDFALLAELARSRPHWSIVLIGKVGEGDPWTDVSPLAALPNVHRLGPRPYAELPAYLRAFDVALLPNARNAYTDSMFPMKFFEYLASGRPIVSVDLPALREFHDVAWLAGSAEDFLAAAEAILDGAVPPLALRLARARRHTYDARLDRMLALLDAAVSSRPEPAGSGAAAAARAESGRAA